MVTSMPVLATRAGLPVYIPHLPVRTRLIERLNERVRVCGCNKPEGMMKESQVDKEIASTVCADI